MKITRENYESFFLDYLEGNLEETHIDLFLDFLKQNPDLKEELHLFENIPLPEEPVVFLGKESLYRSANNLSFDRKAVAYMEGDLKDRERKAFEATLARNPKLQAEYALFEKTRLTAEADILFPQKEKLYKKSVTLLLINWVGRAAAILLLLWGITVLFQTGEDTRPPVGTDKVAVVKKPSIKVPSDSQPKVTEHRESETTGQSIASTAKQGVLSADPSKEVVNTNQESQASGAENNQRDFFTLEKLATIPAHLENEPELMALAPINLLNKQKRNDQPVVITLDEYLALKAKRATNEGILSANRLLRVGLNVASELSGERLGYTVRNGKVASLDFESKLLAFEIPLEKK